MKRTAIFAAVVAVLASPASAFTFFSIGATSGPGPGDPGLAIYETAAVTFDTPPIIGVTDTVSGTNALYTGTSGGVAAAPVGDTSVYQALGTGGASLFDFTSYAAAHTVNTFSIYIGSIDTYNYIDVLDTQLNVIGTISGSQLPGSNGDQGASITNRRVFISATAGEMLGGLRFHSDGVAFEYDTIGVSAKSFAAVPPGSVLPTAPIPEPAVWTLLIAGFAMTGFAARRRRIIITASVRL